MPQIEVAFDIDANGIVHVSAKDKATNREQAISIKASGGLSDDEINQMVKDAELHAEEDKKRKDLIQERNMAQETINGANKLLEENADKIAEEIKSEIKGNIEDTQKILESENVDEIKQAAQKLMTAMSKAGEAIHKAAQDSSQQQSAAADQPPKDDNVVDAEYKVEDNK
jgi:molecular chaperone DnaK